MSNPRPLAALYQSYGGETAGELAMLRVAADAHRRYGPAAVPAYVISKADSVSDILEVAVATTGGRLLPPRGGRRGVGTAPWLRATCEPRPRSRRQEELLGAPPP